MPSSPSKRWQRSDPRDEVDFFIGTHKRAKSLRKKTAAVLELACAERVSMHTCDAYYIAMLVDGLLRACDRVGIGGHEARAARSKRPT